MEDNYIKSVDEGSPLYGRVESGDTVIAINGNQILDVLDYKFFAYDKSLKVRLKRPDGSEYELDVKKSEGGDLGLNFESYLMDKQRIIALHISPINVSVQTTNPELRCEMLRNKRAGESIDVMRRFAKAGIVMNCQIVCCPGLNDGEELLRSMQDLEQMHPAVHSVSIVPVGLTKFREKLYPLTPFTPEHAAETIDLVESFGDKCVHRHGTRIFFCGDEMYIKAGRELPDEDFYEEYTQLENGVGMIRLLETEFRSALKLSDEPDYTDFSIATGTSVAPYFEKFIAMAREKYPGIKGRVYAIENDFFGHSINVTGLITGGDLIRQLKDKPLGERLFISQNMLRRQEMDFLDDVLLEDAVEALGVPIYPIESDGFALWDAISGVLPEVKLPVREESHEAFYKYNQN